MAYAIIQSGGKQFRVTEGEVVRVPSITAEIGSSVEFNVLVSGDGDQIDVGAPVLDGPRVTATVLEHGRGTKIIVFKKKRRSSIRRHTATGRISPPCESIRSARKGFEILYCFIRGGLMRPRSYKRVYGT